MLTGFNSIPAASARVFGRGVTPGGAAANAGSFTVSWTSSPTQGGGVILSAFKNTGSAAIGIHKMASTTAASSVTTAAATSQASGSTFVLDVIVQYGANISVSDSKGNSYGSPHIQAANYSGAFDLVRFICLNGTGGASHTASVSSNNGATEITAFFTEITNCTLMGGASVSTVDSTDPITSPAIDVTVPSAILLSACAGDGFGSNYTMTATGYTQLDIEPAADGAHAQGVTGWKAAP